MLKLSLNGEKRLNFFLEKDLRSTVQWLLERVGLDESAIKRSFVTARLCDQHLNQNLRVQGSLVERQQEGT